MGDILDFERDQFKEALEEKYGKKTASAIFFVTGNYGPGLDDVLVRDFYLHRLLERVKKFGVDSKGIEYMLHSIYSMYDCLKWYERGCKEVEDRLTKIAESQELPEKLKEEMNKVVSRLREYSEFDLLKKVRSILCDMGSAFNWDEKKGSEDE
ncbi:hypothetical protein DRJ16_00615 [Candidatus Woesearchaeota archaeon]|nr:MAG: hypothetical protein DRJ16_00615 [Candidatus Woesearchaeota archaeon]